MNTWHFKSFIRWWETEQKRFHCGQFSDRDIAYSAWLAGITYYTGKLKKKEKKISNPQKKLNDEEEYVNCDKCTPLGYYLSDGEYISCRSAHRLGLI